ncbi:hypothetical protein ACPZ19_43700 [Amycolatopsis lurida]
MSVTNDGSAELDLMFVNFDHGGASSDQAVDFCMDGLVELVGADDRWPDLGVIAEANFWRFFGSCRTASRSTGNPTALADERAAPTRANKKPRTCENRGNA